MRGNIAYLILCTQFMNQLKYFISFDILFRFEAGWFSSGRAEYGSGENGISAAVPPNQSGAFHRFTDLSLV